MIFQAKLRVRKFVYSPFAPEDMLGAGQVVCDANFARWDQGLNTMDLPAKPLAPGYAKFKSQHGAKPIRDLRYSGILRRCLKPLSADQRRVVCGAVEFTHPLPVRLRPGKKGQPAVTRQLTINEILSFNQGIERMWGISPRDSEQVNLYVRKLLVEHCPIAPEK